MAGRYFRRGKSKILWVLEVADIASITRIELDAGVDLSLDIADIAGFQLENSPITTPNLADAFTPQIDGEDTAPTSTLTIYDRDDDDANRVALTKGTAGHVVLLPYGDVDTERLEVWPAKTTGVNDVWSTGNEAARFVAGFAITEVPEQNGTVPAAV